MLLLALPVTLPAQFNYVITDGKATITGYTGPGGSVTIPNTLDGCPVTIIGNNAFSGLANVTSISIPNNVTSIGDFAFEGCSGLTNMTIENNVTSIGYCAFQSCSSLTSLKLGPSVTSIGDYAFEECRSLTNVTIGSGVTTIGVMAFFDCSRLSSVWMGSSVTSIGGSAFVKCASLMGIYCYGNAPNLDVSPFSGDNNATVHYLPGTTGWGTTFGGLPTALWIQPPTIQTPPRTQTAEAGSAVGFGVKASSPFPLFFFWYFNASNFISCSTNSELELASVQLSQSGAYNVVVSNILGAVTSSPAMLQVIAPVQRRPVPGVQVTGAAGSLLNVDYANSLSPALNWAALGSVSLTSTSQYYFDLTLPLPPQRFYRAWRAGAPGMRPLLDLHMIPAITMKGNIGGSVRLDAINQFGPIDAWFTLATVTLTNTLQLYFDTSSWRQPQRLYRLVQVP